MGQKDLALKTLESINEVFSDITNNMLFRGEEVIDPNDLSEATIYSQFKTAKHYHEQERDVAKYWNDCGIRIAFIGIENQTTISKYMPLRIISYDGGAYKAQIPTDNQSEKTIHPVCSMVLYFGTKKEWTEPTSLKEVLNVPPELEPYVNDYKIHVVNVAFLEREVIDRFKSDFWYVADYFWQIRNNKEYKPSKKAMKNAHAVLQMMSAMTGDKRFEMAYNEVKEESGGEGSMCEYLDKIVAEGKREGKREEAEAGMKSLVEVCAELGASSEVTEEKLMQKYMLSQAEAQEKIAMYMPNVA